MTKTTIRSWIPISLESLKSLLGMSNNAKGLYGPSKIQRREVHAPEADTSNCHNSQLEKTPGTSEISESKLYLMKIV